MRRLHKKRGWYVTRHNTHHDNLFKNSENRWHFSCCTESNPALRTPHYYGQLSLSLGKAHTYYIWTPVNADNRHLFLAQLTDIHRKWTSLTQTLLCQLTSFFIDLVFCSNKGCIFTYTRRVYYTCIGLQRSNIFYAEFKALPKPSTP